jgi:hypothetical protein
MVVNELKIHMKINHSKQFFNVHVKEIKIEIYPKILWYELMKIWLILGHSKVHNFFFVNFFLAIVLHKFSFCFNISYIESL